MTDCAGEVKAPISRQRILAHRIDRREAKPVLFLPMQPQNGKPDRMGDFLVKIGAMTPEQVQAVLHLQEMGNPQRFGEIALALGYLNDDAIKRYLDYLEKHGSR